MNSIDWNALLVWVKATLGSPIWQGVAGIAQITAAVLTVVAIWLAKRSTNQGQQMLERADKARLDSVAPEWEIINNANRLEGREVSLASIKLQNVGLEPARGFQVRFQPKNNRHALLSVSSSNMREANITSILKDDVLFIQLRLEPKEGPLDGFLEISCTTLLGETRRTRFNVSGDASEMNSRPFKIAPETRAL